jgi:uncharacterized LabA/DUF88 family protein
LNHFTQRKEVDSTMVTDMFRPAAVGVFDIVVLMSGDADRSPAVKGVHGAYQKGLQCLRAAYAA